MVSEKGVGARSHLLAEMVSAWVDSELKDSFHERRLCVLNHLLDADTSPILLATENEKSGGFHQAHHIFDITVTHDSGEDEVELDPWHVPVVC